MTPHDLGASMRQRILSAVRSYPGLHLRELARQLDTSVALIEYHLPMLVAKDLVERVEDQGRHLLFPTGHDAPRRLVGLLRDKRRLPIILTLLDQGPLTHGEMVGALGLGKSTLSFHLRHLTKAGILENTVEGFRIRDPRRVRRTLAAHRPTPDMLDRFAGTWGDLYG